MLTITEVLKKDILAKLYANNNIYKNDRNKYFKLLSNLNEEGELEVSYEVNTYNGNPYGRYYPQEISMCSAYMWRRARASIYGDCEYDLDMVSAHPNIARYIYNRERGDGRFERDFPKYMEYIEDRDSVIDRFEIPNCENIIRRFNEANMCDYTKKDIVKFFYNTALYGASINTWKRKFGIGELPREFYEGTIKKVYDEVKELTEYITRQETYKQLCDDVKEEHKKKRKKMDNEQGTLMSLILQEEEREFVKFMMDGINRSENFRVSSYNYDGFQARHTSGTKTDEIKRELVGVINRLDRQMYEKYGDVSAPIRFIIKPFAKPLSEEELNDVDMKTTYLMPYFENPNKNELAKYVNYLVGDGLVCRGDKMYRYTGKVWREYTKQELTAEYNERIYRDIRETLHKCFDTTDPKLDAKTRKVLENVKKNIIRKSSDTYIDQALKLASDLKTNPSIQFDEIRELLNFRNGTLNLNTWELQGHNPADYLTYMIPHDYIVDTNWDSVLKEVVDFMVNWYDDGEKSTEEARRVAAYQLWYIGKSLHGENFVEKALVMLGKMSRNGKSTLVDLLEKAFAEYVGTLPMKYFTSYDKSADAPCPELVATRGKRILIVPEAGGSDLKIVNEKFKKIVGGDTLTGRELYSNIIERFKFQGILFFPSNYHLSFTTQGNDTIGKLDYIEYNCYFGDETFTGWDASKRNHKRVDPTFKHRITPEFIQKFANACLYLARTGVERPAIVDTWVRKNRGEVNNVDSWCDENLSYDPNDRYFTDEDYIIRQNICRILTEKFNKLCLKDKKLERQLTYDFLYSRYKKDVGDNAVSKKNFDAVLSVKYRDFIPEKKTRLFGGQKNYISGWRYNVPDDEDEDDDLPTEVITVRNATPTENHNITPPAMPEETRREIAQFFENDD